MSQRDFQNISLSQENILNSFSKIEVIGSWSKSDESLEFKNDDMELISQQNLDCIIHCGSEILQGDILNSQKFGVISSPWRWLEK